jgi:hypothetical protein
MTVFVGRDTLTFRAIIYDERTVRRSFAEYRKSLAANYDPVKVLIVRALAKSGQRVPAVKLFHE